MLFLCFSSWKSFWTCRKCWHHSPENLHNLIWVRRRRTVKFNFADGSIGSNHPSTTNSSRIVQNFHDENDIGIYAADGFKYSIRGYIYRLIQAVSEKGEFLRLGNYRHARRKRNGQVDHDPSAGRKARSRRQWRNRYESHFLCMIRTHGASPFHFCL